MKTIVSVGQHSAFQKLCNQSSKHMINLQKSPVLTLNVCKQGKVSDQFFYPRHVMELLVDQEGYTNLGWLNGGVVPPALDDWMEQYRNYTGSYTIYVSHGSKLIYCVDMGD